MRKKILLSMFAFLLVCGKMQAQTIVYTYSSTGECISRVLAKAEGKAREQAGSDSSPDMLRVEVSPSPKITDNLSISVCFLKETVDLWYFLSDVSGKQFLHGSLHEGDNTLSTQKLPQGYYILTIEGQKYQKTYKLVKE